MSASKKIQYLGLLGLVAFVFGLLSFFLITHDEYFFTHIHLIGGVILIVLFLLKGGLRPIGTAAAKRAAGFGLGLTLYSAMFFGIIVLLNYYVSRHDPLHYDSTEQQVFTLAPQTLKVLNSLESPVVIRGFYVGGQVSPDVKELIGRLTRVSENIEFKIIDPEKSPGLTEKYGVNERETLHLSFSDPESTREVKIVRNIDEQNIVNAILKLTRGGDEKKIYWLSGHGESDLDGSSESGFLFLQEAIRGENLIAERLELSSLKEIPVDASAVLLMAPRKSLLKTEREKLSTYLETGGHALLLSEPNTVDDIAEIVEPLGIVVGGDIILDQVVRLFAGPGVGVQPMVMDYAEHPITDGFSEGTIFSTVSSVRKADSIPEGASLTEFAFTSENSWAEKKVDLIFSEKPEAALDPEDIKGPISIAVAFEGAIKGGSASRVVVIGDADFVANVNIRQLFNRDLFLNTLNWVVGEQERVSIRAGTLKASSIALTARQFNGMFLITALLIPELILFWGMAVWWYRR